MPTTLQDEPTQASIRARLLELTDGLLPSAEDVSSMGIHPGAPPAREALVPAERRLLESGPPPSVAYLLPGLPPEGSGGSHSLVQEARGLRRLGARARVCVPQGSLALATALYGNQDQLFAPYPAADSALPGVSDMSGFAGVLEAVADADVVVATEYPSVDLLARLAAERPRVLYAYYVQDYEPLFAAPQSSRSDRALLSYRALPHLLLFAKTHWLGNLLGAVHGVEVAKVAPSLDRELFHPGGRSRHAGVLRIAAMIRPRTPRRRPLATLRALAAISRALGDGVRISTFGCDRDAFAELRQVSGDGWVGEDRVSGDLRDSWVGGDGGVGGGRFTHLGLLSRMQVSSLMRRCDVFIDASAYQAFGRTGLEAMACGALPLLPQLGGVHEYALHGENAVILDGAAPAEIASAVLDLASSPARLARMSDAGLRQARRFSVERAARSQLALFVQALA